MKSDRVRHPDESQDPFSAGVGCEAIRHRSRAQRANAPVFAASEAQDCEQYQRCAEWMLTFVSMTSQMQLPCAHLPNFTRMKAPIVRDIV
jgi:hypothetical protein